MDSILSLVSLGKKIGTWVDKIRKLPEIARENKETISSIKSIVEIVQRVGSVVNAHPALKDDEGISQTVRLLLETCGPVVQMIEEDQDSENVLKKIWGVLKKIWGVLNPEEMQRKLSQMEGKLKDRTEYVQLSLNVHSAIGIHEILDCVRQPQQQGQEARKPFAPDLDHQAQAGSSVSSDLVRLQVGPGETAAASEMHQEISVPEGPGETAGGNGIGSSATSNDNLQPAEVYPLVLRFPQGKSRCSITLINRTDKCVGFRIKQTEPTFPQFIKTISDIVEPRSTLARSVELLSDEGQQPAGSWVKLEARMISLELKEKLEKLMQHVIPPNVNISIDDVKKMVKKLKGEVRQTMLTAVVVGCEPENNMQVDSKFELKDGIKSIDVHPTETWILITHMSGNLSIHDYNTKRTLHTLASPAPVKGMKEKTGFLGIRSQQEVPRRFVSAKFISRENVNWVAAGDSAGYIHVYDWSGYTLREEFKALTSGKSVDSLAVHPTKPYLLSSSSTDDTIWLWGWDRDNKWEQKQVFKDDETKKGVRSLTFNPRDHGSFACVTMNENALVWRIDQSPTNTPWREAMDAEYVSTRPDPWREVMDAEYVSTRPDFLAILRSTSEKSTSERLLQIWNLRAAQKPAHTLQVWKDDMESVACHPTLPILATFSRKTGNVCLWDANTYRLEKEVHIASGPSAVKLLFPDTRDLPRLFVWWKISDRHPDVVAVVDATLPKEEEIKAAERAQHQSSGQLALHVAMHDPAATTARFERPGNGAYPQHHQIPLSYQVQQQGNMSSPNFAGNMYSGAQHQQEWDSQQQWMGNAQLMLALQLQALQQQALQAHCASAWPLNGGQMAPQPIPPCPQVQQLQALALPGVACSQNGGANMLASYGQMAQPIPPQVQQQQAPQQAPPAPARLRRSRRISIMPPMSSPSGHHGLVNALNTMTMNPPADDSNNSGATANYIYSF